MKLDLTVHDGPMNISAATPAAESSFNPHNDMIGSAWPTAQTDVVVEFLQVASRIVRQEHRKAHQRVSRRSRRRPMASAAGRTFRSSICRFPSARIFSSAIVSCVHS